MVFRQYKTHLNSTIAQDGLERIAQVWEVSDNYGLALADLIDAVRQDIYHRLRFARRTEAELAGTRATAAVLTALPILGIGLGQLMGADPLHLLFTTMLGHWLLFLGSLLTCCGLLWTSWLMDRVLQ
jgi:tight adherence protein B